MVEARWGIDIGGWQGLAIGDVNGDGLEDVYICQPGGLPNRLYVQNADGSADRSLARGGRRCARIDACGACSRISTTTPIRTW